MQAWIDVEALLTEMKPLLVEAGIPERQVKMPEGKPAEEIPIDQYVKAFDWLHKLATSPEWYELHRIKALCPDHVWANYKAMQITGLREQLMLQACQFEIRKLWKNKRPSLFGRVYKPKAEDADADST